MSKDNGIYILKLKNECRLAHIYAAGNILINKVFLQQAFNDAVCVSDYQDALVLADNIDKEHHTEHGVKILDRSENTWSELINKKDDNVIHL